MYLYRYQTASSVKRKKAGRVGSELGGQCAGDFNKECRDD